MENVLSFFKENYNFTVPDSNMRLKCIQKIDQSVFQRKKKRLDVELYSNKSIEYLDQHISIVQVFVLI